MHASSLYLHLLVLASAPSYVLARPSSCGAPPKNSTNGKAIYFLTNDKSNAVVALPIGQDGLLQAPGSKTATGGSGGNGVTAPDNKPAAPDALFSQGSLTIAGNVRFLQIPHLDAFVILTTCSTETLCSQSWIQHTVHVLDRSQRSHQISNAREADFRPRRISNHCRRLQEA